MLKNFLSSLAIFTLSCVARPFKLILQKKGPQEKQLRLLHLILLTFVENIPLQFVGWLNNQKSKKYSHFCQFYYPRDHINACILLTFKELKLA